MAPGAAGCFDHAQPPRSQQLGALPGNASWERARSFPFCHEGTAVTEQRLSEQVCTSDRQGLGLRLLLLLAPTVLGMANAAAACDAPEPATFKIVHEAFGEIGRHALDFRCDGEDLIVETDARIEVEVVAVTAYRRKAHYREVWRDDRLIAFNGRTMEDDEPKTVTARRREDHMLIEGPAGRIEAPLDAVPDNPWNRDVAQRSVLFDVSSGDLLRVHVRHAGQDTVEMGGQPVAADKYTRSGDREHALWYGEDGRWLQWRLERTTGAITFVRQKTQRR